MMELTTNKFFSNLDDERGSFDDNFIGNLIQRTVLDAHDLKIRTVGKFVREAVKGRVVVDVQGFQVFQVAWLKW